MTRKIFIENSYKLKIAAILELPKVTGQVPCVLIVPGFLGYKEGVTLEALANTLLEQNIASIRFDPSGFAESEGTLENDYRLSNFISDIATVYEYLKTLPQINLQKTFITGISMGGIAAVIAATQHQYAGVCLIASPTMLGRADDLTAQIKNWTSLGYLTRFSSKYGELQIPAAFIENARGYDALKYVNLIKAPLQVIIGEKDEIVNPTDTMKYFEMAKEPKKLILIPEMHHSYKQQPQQIQAVNHAVISFLRQYS
ncbi:MAG: alpha/beta fold hydrolase [bacterium]